MFFLPVLAAIFGVASICLAFAAPYMGPIMLQIPPILNACFGAPINVLFAVSILWPYTNVWVMLHVTSS